MSKPDQIASREEEKRQYETELVSPADVLNDLQNYKIEGGKVFSNDSGQEELDEDTVLRVKTSRFLLNTALSIRKDQEHVLLDRFVDRGTSYYVDKAMEKYGFKDEDTSFAEGRMLKGLVDNLGHHQTISGDTLANSKYDMFIGQKADYGKALLKRRLKQHGLEMRDMTISIDTTNAKKDGYSTVDIKVDAAPIEASGIHHPAAEQLSQLEEELRKAQADGDEVAVNGYRAAMRSVVENNRMEVTADEWNKMDVTQKERFFRIKMKEEKILGDKDAYDFWSNNLNNLIHSN